MERGEDFHTGAKFEIHPFPFLSKCKKGREKSSVAVRIDVCIRSSNFHLTSFVDQSHSRLFVEIYIRACDKLTIFSKYARAYWRTGSYAPDFQAEPSRRVYCIEYQVPLGGLVQLFSFY